MRVPEGFKAVFWDVEIAGLDRQKHRRYIIERILNFGDIEHFRWMFRVYSKSAIAERK